MCLNNLVYLSWHNVVIKLGGAITLGSSFDFNNNLYIIVDNV